MKIIEEVVRKFIADDGKEFSTEEKCFEYENNCLIMSKKRKDLRKMLFLENYPPCDGEEIYERYYYDWYKLNNDEEQNLLNDAYQAEFNCAEFPEYVCLELEEFDDTFTCCPRGYATFSSCADYVIRFFNAFGYEVSITESKKSDGQKTE